MNCPPHETADGRQEDFVPGLAKEINDLLEGFDGNKESLAVAVGARLRDLVFSPTYSEDLRKMLENPLCAFTADSLLGHIRRDVPSLSPLNDDQLYICAVRGADDIVRTVVLGLGSCLIELGEPGSSEKQTSRGVE